MIKGFGNDDPDYKKMKTWSLVYYLGKEHTDFLKEAYGECFSTNGLNPTVFHSLKRFENEVISMTAEMLHGDEKTCGVMTAGGTESCLRAVKTYRDMARAKRPWIRKPEMVILVTAHVAWEKGAEYFNVKPVRAPLDDNYMVDVKAIKKLIWLTVVKRKNFSCPTNFYWSLLWLYSRAPKRAEPKLRRLITLIFAGWLPHDLASSWSCLSLIT